MPDFLPRTESTLLLYSASFGQRLVLDPAGLGVPPDLVADYLQAQARFAASVALTASPAGRSPPNFVAKRHHRAELLLRLRRLAGIVRANPQVDLQQRVLLGLRVPGPGHYARIAAPGRAPTVALISCANGMLRLRLSDPEAPTRRAKPAGVATAVVLLAESAQPPASMREWSLAATVSRMTATIAVPEVMSAGGSLWVTAMYRNGKGEAGPAAAPVCLRREWSLLAVA